MAFKIYSLNVNGHLQLEYTHNILYINPYSPGSVVQLNCDSGFYPYGLTIATCVNGEWTMLGTCITFGKR